MTTRYMTITGILKTGGTGYIMIAREAIEDGTDEADIDETVEQMTGLIKKTMRDRSNGYIKFGSVVIDIPSFAVLAVRIDEE